MEEQKITNEYLIDDDELENVSGGMKPLRSISYMRCPKCNKLSDYSDKFAARVCNKCGCKWDDDTGVIIE